MTLRAIYAYAWDVLDAGVPEFVDDIRGLGLNTVTLAGSYHAGKFLRPHAQGGKVYFPEDGTVYFRADPARYGAIKPALYSRLGERDVFRELCDHGDVQVNAWMVLLHNTRLGAAHPESTVQNCFGDRYVYSLCPSAPEARAFAVALCRDVTDNYSVVGVSVETPGFLPYAHGFHHEFALVKPNRWLEALLGLCFCPHCLGGAEAAGIDARRLRAQVAADIESYLAGDFDLPADMAEAFWLADVQGGGEIGAFLRWRCQVVTSLVAEIRAALRADAQLAVIPSVARPTAGAWYEGTDFGALANSAGIIEACFYEPSVARIRADLWDVRRRMGGAGRLRAILRPAYPDLESRAEVVAAAEALHATGIADIAFYNYGHLRRESLAWIADALAAWGE